MVNGHIFFLEVDNQCFDNLSHDLLDFI